MSWALAVLALSVLPGGAAADAGCSMYAAPDGWDGNPGTKAAPFASPIHLLGELGPGQTGCLKDGASFWLDGGEGQTSAHGETGKPIVLRPETPGKRVSIEAKTGFAFAAASHDVVLQDLDLSRTEGLGLGGSMMLIDGDEIVLDHVDATYADNICLDVGPDPRAGAVDSADRIVIRRSRIHHCGSDYGPPRDKIVDGKLVHDSGVHGIYVELARSMVIEDNLIYENHNRGIQLYPDADFSTIRRNVLHHNGANLNFGHDAEIISEHNDVEANILTDSVLSGLAPDGFVGDQAEVTGNLPDRDLDNHVEHNCIASAAHPDKLYLGPGFTHATNVENQPPGYANAAAGDFRLAAGSPCAGKGPQVATGSCRGLAATVPGLVGTPYNDVLVGTGGNDTMDGKGGDDIICGGGGFDTIAGGPGADVIDGGAGGDGADYGGAAGPVKVDLGLGGLVQETREGKDTLISMSQVYGSAYGDRLYGRNVDPASSLDAELLYGGGGNDVIEGRGGDDTVSGGPGHDSLRGGAGRDVFLGGAGLDTATYSGRVKPVVVRLGDGVAEDGEDADGDGAAEEGDAVKIDVERVAGGDGDDRLYGSAYSNLLAGGPGADLLDGAGARDTLLGGPGTDTLLAKDGIVDFTLDCGVGADQLTSDVNDPATECETIGH
ncbi:MAG TPA: right-handed parallel beta-helix repeat-containing protein [Solirubrobacteraceae bacterium]